MLEITIRDVLGTARVSANIAYDAITRLYESRLIEDDPILDRAINEACKTLSDLMLVKHMNSPDWTDATYVKGQY